MAIFDYPIEVQRLDNGLQLIVVPLGSTGLTAFHTVVGVGSRNEVDPGLSGFAHFFEHMMFRGTPRYPSEEYHRLFKLLGSDSNAFTSDDLTCYHSLFGSDGIERVMDAESDRFKNLEYTLADFQQESRAVLGEYHKNYSNPMSKLYETIRDTAYTTHPYKHTTMGFLKDIEDMPNQHDYSISFFERFYRPNNVSIIVVGDVTLDRTLMLVERYYGDWESGLAPPAVPIEPEQDSKRSAHVDWQNETLPYIAFAYHVPAFGTVDATSAGIHVLARLLFGRTSPLYRELVIERQICEELSFYVPDRRDPGLMMVVARLSGKGHMDEVKRRVEESIRGACEGLIDDANLVATRSRLKYSVAMSLDTAKGVAAQLTHYVGLTGDPLTINHYHARLDDTRASDVQEIAVRYLTDRNCTEVTLAGPNEAD